MPLPEKYSPLADEFRHNIDGLHALDGWHLLNPLQQRLITDLFFIQSRAGRPTIQTNIFPFLDNHYLRANYDISNQIMDDWYCHGTIASLETLSTSVRRTSDIDSSFFETTYYSISNFADLVALTTTIPYPSVLHIKHPRPIDSETYWHSCLILDHKPHEPAIFDKAGYYFPFRLLSLNDIYSHFGSFFHYGVRPLQTQLS